jgi:hypothetical protein
MVIPPKWLNSLDDRQAQEMSTAFSHHPKFVFFFFLNYPLCWNKKFLEYIFNQCPLTVEAADESSA